HPVIRTHPESGRDALYVNSVFTKNFEGMTREESAPLLQYLFAHLSKPEFVCRFRWQPGSLAFWDNRCTQHFAINDYHGFRRHMNRVTLLGDAPFLTERADDPAHAVAGRSRRKPCGSPRSTAFPSTRPRRPTPPESAGSAYP
ncbi:MAG TPA: hypothetical protein DEB21_00155, partial [Rhodospirillaceae bacterium]|nr:hypothetical protein [Rhodospirillaceae bacterium]